MILEDWSILVSSSHFVLFGFQLIWIEEEVHLDEVILSACSLIGFSANHGVVLVVELITMLRKAESYVFIWIYFVLCFEFCLQENI